MRLKLVHSLVAIAILFCGHNSLGSAAQATAKGESSDEKSQQGDQRTYSSYWGGDVDHAVCPEK